MTFKNIFQKTPTSSPVQNKKTSSNEITKSEKLNSAKKNQNKSANEDDIFDFESSNHPSSKSLMPQSNSFKVNVNEKISPKPSTSKISKLDFQNPKSNMQNSKSNNNTTSTPKSSKSNTLCNKSSLGELNTSSQPSQADNISNYFAKKSAAAGIEPSTTTRRITLSKDIRERKKQIVRVGNHFIA